MTIRLILYLKIKAQITDLGFLFGLYLGYKRHDKALSKSIKMLQSR